MTETTKTKRSYDLYKKIAEERGLSSYKVSMETKVPQSAFSLWKLHGIVPKWDRMNRIAQFLSTPEKPLTVNDFYQADADQEGGSYEV